MKTAFGVNMIIYIYTRRATVVNIIFSSMTMYMFKSLIIQIMRNFGDVCYLSAMYYNYVWWDLPVGVVFNRLMYMPSLIDTD